MRGRLTTRASVGRHQRRCLRDAGAYSQQPWHSRPPINVFSNSFIPGATLGQSRMEFAAHNGGLLAKVDLDNVLGTFESAGADAAEPG